VTERQSRPLQVLTRTFPGAAYVIEFDDRDATDALRFNAIGMVDGRMLIVTIRMGGAVVRIIPPRGQSRMKKRSRLNPKKPPKTGWQAFDAMSEAERRRAALSDPDCPA
jgi:hypothetical protein